MWQIEREGEDRRVVVAEREDKIAPAKRGDKIAVTKEEI